MAIMKAVKNDCVILLGGGWAVNVWFKTIKLSQPSFIFLSERIFRNPKAVSVDVFAIWSNLPLWFAVIKFPEGCS